MTLKGARSVSSIRQQVVDDVMSMALKGPQPSTVRKFAYYLTNALIGRDLPVTPISQISESIVDVLRSAGARDFRFFASLFS